MQKQRKNKGMEKQEMKKQRGCLQPERTEVNTEGDKGKRDQQHKGCLIKSQDILLFIFT